MIDKIDLNLQITTIINDLPFWGLTVGILVFIYFSWLIIRQIFLALKNARFIEDTPTSKIRSAPQGYIELEGTALANPNFAQRSPLTNKPCCWYSYLIEEYVTNRVGNKIESKWIEVFSNRSPNLFILDDGTGECVICPIDAEVTARHKNKWIANKIPEHLVKKKNNDNRKYRFTEIRIEEGDPLYVIGNFESVQYLEKFYEPLTKKTKRKNEGMKRKLTPFIDTSEVINNEWAYYQKINTNNKQLNVIRKKEGTNLPFLISAYPQKKLARKYRLQAIGYTLLFLALTTFPFILILQRYTSFNIT